MSGACMLLMMREYVCEPHDSSINTDGVSVCSPSTCCGISQGSTTTPTMTYLSRSRMGLRPASGCAGPCDIHPELHPFAQAMHCSPLVSRGVMCGWLHGKRELGVSAHDAWKLHPDAVYFAKLMVWSP